MTEYHGPVDAEVVEDAIEDIEDLLDRDSWRDISAARRPLREALDLLEDSLGEEGADPATVRSAFGPLERARFIFHRSPQMTLAHRTEEVNEKIGDAHADVIDREAER